MMQDSPLLALKRIDLRDREQRGPRVRRRARADRAFIDRRVGGR
jgi:hypothetical protein